jgi:hypothetical protein
MHESDARLFSDAVLVVACAVWCGGVLTLALTSGDAWVVFTGVTGVILGIALRGSATTTRDGEGGEAGTDDAARDPFRWQSVRG